MTMSDKPSDMPTDPSRESADSQRLAEQRPDSSSGGKPDKPAKAENPEAAEKADTAQKDNQSEKPPENELSKEPEREPEEEPEERDQRPYLARAKDDEREWRERRRNLLNLDEEQFTAPVGRDWIGRDSINAAGNARIFAAGNMTLINIDTREQASEIQYLAEAEIAWLLERMVDPPSQVELSMLLDRDPLVFLRGAEGTGRRTSAVAALADWVHKVEGNGQPGQVGYIPDNVSLFLRIKSQLRKNSGYIFDVTDSRLAKEFEAHAVGLRHSAVERGYRIVILVPVSWSYLTGQIVDHHPPAADQVFRRWIEQEALAAGVDASIIDELQDDINGELHAQDSPGRAKQLAHRLVTRIQAGWSLDQLRAELPEQVRADIRRRLEEDEPALGRCFLTSATVLNGLPETVVSDAAMKLAEHINDYRPVTDEKRIPAWQSLGVWLKYADAATSPGEGAGSGPTVHLKRSAEIPTLQILWAEQPTIRQPLTDWLRETAESSNSRVYTKAAHAAGVLAAFDFEVAEEKLITPWSKSRRLRDYRLAAMVLESAVRDPGAAPRVHERVAELADSEKRGDRLIAAHAIGSRIGLDAPSIAMRELRKLALGRDAEVGKAVAGSIGNLYSAGTAAMILEELSTWIESHTAGGHYTAALAFVRLAMIEEDPDTNRPPLSKLKYPSDHAKKRAVEQLAMLWVNSLCFRIKQSGKTYFELVVPDSWNIFQQWVGHYDDETSTARAVVDMVFVCAYANKQLRNALIIHLWRWRYRGIISVTMHRNLNGIMRGTDDL
jgi:hypothetical protein